MKKLLSMMLAVCSFTASAATHQCEVKFNGVKLNDEQWYNVRSVFVNGWLSDLSWSLAAITIVESSAGLNLINNVSKDYGLMQNNIKTATTRLKRWEKAGRDFSPYDLNNPEDVKTILVSKPEISVQLAIEELRYWKKVRGEHNWKVTWASYNGGWYLDKAWQPAAEAYSSKIAATIRKLKPCANELTRGLL